jgi:hypothetical protein
MTNEASRFVPKVHPASRPVEAEDPFSLHANVLAGDPELMLQCVVEEYAWMGWSSEQILELFHNPFYPVLNELGQWFGENELRRRLAGLMQKSGVFHFQVAMHEEAESEPEEAEVQLLQLGLLTRRPEGSDHA